MKAKSIVIPTLVIFGFAIGIVLYFSLFSSENEVITDSFDRKSTFILDDVEFNSLSIYGGRYSNTVIVPDDANKFILDLIDNNPYYVSKHTNYYSILDGEIDIYVFLKDGYYYEIYENDGNVIFRSIYTVFETYTTELYFPFINDYHGFGQESDNFYSWDLYAGLDNFDEVKNYYSEMNDFFYEVDEQNQTISLRTVDVNDDYKYSSGFPIILHFDEDGITVEFIEGEM